MDLLSVIAVLLGFCWLTLRSISQSLGVIARHVAALERERENQEIEREIREGHERIYGEA